MRTVLGFATTQTAIEYVRIEPSPGGGTSVTHHSVAALVGEETSRATYPQLAARVWFRTRRLARATDRPVRSVGVTWSPDADEEGAQLMRSLAAAGFDNIIAVDAAEAERHFESAHNDRRPNADGQLDPHGATSFSAPGHQAILALGAALASTHHADQGPPARERTPGRSWAPAPSLPWALLVVSGLALLVLMSFGPGLRHAPATPSRHVQPAPMDTSWDGPVVVPALPPAPSPPEYRPGPTPPASEQAVVPEAPASVTAPKPLTPPPAVSVPPEQGDQLPPPNPEPPPGEQAPANANCTLLCGVTL